MARRERSFFFDNKTGKLKSNGKTIIDATDSANLLQTEGSAAGNPVNIGAIGDDTNIDIRITPKGSGNVEILGPLEVLTGNRIIDSAGTNVEFGDDIHMNSNKITNLGTPTANTDASTKAYVDTKVGSYLPLTGGTISSNLTVSGNFTVNGTTTTINTSTLSVADNLIDLNSDVTSGTPSQDAGIRILRGDSNAVQLRWNETNDKWELTTDGASYANIAVISDIPTAVSELTNDSGYSTTTGTVTSVAGTGTVNGLTLTGTVTSSGSLTLGGTFSATVSEISDLTATAAELNVLDGIPGTLTATELGYVDGVTSNIQTQIDNISSSFTLAADSGTNDTFTTGQTLTIAGGTGIDTTVSDNNISIAIDSTVATLTGTQTLTNKTLTSPTINAFSGTGNGSITGTLSIVTTTTDDSLLITTTEDSSSAAPVFTLKRNSSSIADGDYLGQIKFKGENDADQEVVYAKITGKILDASDGTEDGIIEIAHKKAGSNNISARFRSDSLQLINGTQLTVDGTSTFNGITVNSSQTINMGSNAITSVADPSSAQDAATKAYVDSQVSSVPTGDITAVNITAGTGLSGTVSTASGDHTQTLSIDSTVATLTGSQTLTNKTLTTPVISSISNTGTLTLPTSTDTLVGRATTDTLTNKTLTSPQVNTNIDLLAQAELEFYDSDSSNYVSFRGPTTVASNITWTLPNTDGTDGQMLSTNGAGTLAWADGGGGGGSGSSYPNSTFSTVPGTNGDFDLSYNVAQTSQETPFEAGGTDAFGVNLGSVFSLMDPIGSIESIDYGDSEAYVGA